MGGIPQPLAQPQQGPMSEQVPGQPGMTSAGQVPSYADLIRALSGQRDTSGLTQVSPVGAPLPPASSQTAPPQREQVQQFGVGGGGAAKRQDAANMAIAAHNLAQNIGQKVEARKQRQYQQVTDQYTGYIKGINEAQSQVQQGTQLVQQAQQRLQANPDDQEAQQMAQRGQQMVQQGKVALQQNQTNLDDLANDPKKHKVILKAFGIDDKNAQSPERQAAIQSIQKQMGVSGQAANLVSRMPARQQLSPEGAAQSEAIKAGIAPRAATQGQMLRAETDLQGQQTRMTIAQLNNAAKQGIQADKLVFAAESKGLTAVRTSDGSLARNPDGSMQWRTMTPEERAKNPYLKSQDDLTAAKTEAQRAIVDSKMNPNNPELRIRAIDAQARVMDANARMIAAQAAQMRASLAKSPEATAAAKKADDLETVYKDAKKFVETPSPTNDTQLVFAYVRSAVAGAGRMTNTEIQQALKSGSFGTQLKNHYDRATKGTLDPTFRQQMADSIGIKARDARETADKYRKPGTGVDVDAQGDVIVVNPEDLK